MEWQSIKTAQKDATLRVLWNTENPDPAHAIFIGRWDQNSSTWTGGFLQRPTRWCALPPLDR